MTPARYVWLVARATGHYTRVRVLGRRVVRGVSRTLVSYVGTELVVDPRRWRMAKGDAAP